LLNAAFSFARHHGWQASEPLAPPRPGVDFYIYLERMQFLHRPEFFTQHFSLGWYYPAPAIFGYAFFYEFCVGDRWKIGYSVMVAIVAGMLLFCGRKLVQAIVARGVRNRSAIGFVLLTVILSFPIYISLQRGNLESVIWFMVAAAIWALRHRRWFTGAVVLGIAASFKIYPALYFGLFFKQRRWKEIAVGLGTMAATTLLALRFMEPDIRFAGRNVLQGVSAFTATYGKGIAPVYDHSLYLLLKIATMHFHPNAVRLLHCYLLIAAAAATALFLGRMLRLPVTNQLLFLATMSVMLPPVSFEYTLQSLYIPWAWILLLLLTPRIPTRWWQGLTMVLFAVLMAPITFIEHRGTSWGGAVKAVALVGLLAVSIVAPMQEREPTILEA